MSATEAYAEDGTGTATLELLESATRYNSWLASMLEPFMGENNLELGAGHGTLTALVARGRKVVASEPSATGRAVLSRRFAGDPQVVGVVADVAELPDVEAFDSIYSANVLEHVADDVALVKRSARVLRPGGTSSPSCRPVTGCTHASMHPWATIVATGMPIVFA